MNVLTPNNSNRLKYSLKIGLFNARSLCNEISLVTEFIHENNIDLLCVTETWLKVKDKAKTLTFSLKLTQQMQSNFFK